MTSPDQWSIGAVQWNQTMNLAPDKTLGASGPLEALFTGASPGFTGATPYSCIGFLIEKRGGVGRVKSHCQPGFGKRQRQASRKSARTWSLGRCAGKGMCERANWTLQTSCSSARSTRVTSKCCSSMYQREREPRRGSSPETPDLWLSGFPPP